jgi:fumarate reductase subunit D
MAAPRTTGYRRDALWLAAMVHRVSGLLLACFLPVHFLVLGLAIESEARLDNFLRWTDRPLVKLAEAVLVALLAVHLAGGLRLLLIENLSWRGGQKRMAAAVLLAAVVAGLLFLAVTALP